jgi:hypothetical protein
VRLQKLDIKSKIGVLIKQIFVLTKENDVMKCFFRFGYFSIFYCGTQYMKPVLPPHPHPHPPPPTPHPLKIRN